MNDWLIYVVHDSFSGKREWKSNGGCCENIWPDLFFSLHVVLIRTSRVLFVCMEVYNKRCMSLAPLRSQSRHLNIFIVQWNLKYRLIFEHAKIYSFLCFYIHDAYWTLNTIQFHSIHIDLQLIAQVISVFVRNNVKFVLVQTLLSSYCIWSNWPK